MKSAILIVNTDRKINVYDYVSKIEPLLKNLCNYDKVYCLLNDLTIEDVVLTDEDKNNVMLENVQTLINLGLSDNVEYIVQSNIKGIYELTNKLSKYVYVSKMIKNEYLRSSIQKNSINDIRLNSLANIVNLISAIVLINSCDLYETPKFESLYKYARKIINTNNELQDDNIFLPQLILNSNIKIDNLSTDGNNFISDKFDNDIPLSLEGDALETKINGIFTDPNHIRVQDKGCVKNNPLFVFVDAICEDSDVLNFFKLNSKQKLKNAYENGGIGDYKVKCMLLSAFKRKFRNCNKIISKDLLLKRLH